MKTQIIKSLVTLMVAFILFLPLISCSNDSNSKKNVVFFLVDDLGWGDCSYNGAQFINTAFIDSFSESSLVFTNAYSAAPGCSPTRASIMTGKYPARLHLTGWIPQKGKSKESHFLNYRLPEQKNYLSSEEKTLAEYLKQAGYATAHIGKWHLGHGEEYSPKSQGFDSDSALWYGASPKSYFSPYRIKTLSDGPKGEYMTDRITDEAVEFIKSHKNESFFLNVWHYGVHTPLRAKQDKIEKYRTLGCPEKGMHNAAFQAMKESIDESFAKIVTALKEEGLYENTIIVFFSDNGGVHIHADNGPLKGGKKMLYEGGIRVPMMVHCYPYTQNGGSTNEAFNSVDFLPTLLDLSGNPIDGQESLDGRSFKKLIQGEVKTIGRDAVYWHWPHAFIYGPQSAIRKGDYKLIRFWALEKSELYNLKDDIGENQDLYEKMPELAKELEEDLDTWLTSVNAQLPTKDPAKKAYRRINGYQILNGDLKKSAEKITIKSGDEDAIAVHKLDKRYEKRITIRGTIHTTKSAVPPNGFFMFGESPYIEQLMRAGIYDENGIISIEQMYKPEKYGKTKNASLGNSSNYEIEIKVDVERKTVNLEVDGGAEFQTELNENILGIEYVGFGLRPNSTSSFKISSIEGV